MLPASPEETDALRTIWKDLKEGRAIQRANGDTVFDTSITASHISVLVAMGLLDPHIPINQIVLNGKEEILNLLRNRIK